MCIKCQRGESSFAAPTGSADSCNCWHEKDNKLREMGYKIADACAMFQIINLSLTAKFGLPLERTDGKKPKRGDPRMITISFCPFCGRRLHPQNEKGQR